MYTQTQPSQLSKLFVSGTTGLKIWSFWFLGFLFLSSIGIFQTGNAQQRVHPLEDLVSAHYRCNALFDLKRLSQQEITACAELYEQLKLRFVDGTSWKKFTGLSDDQRSSLSQQAVLFDDNRLSLIETHLHSFLGCMVRHRLL